MVLYCYIAHSRDKRIFVCITNLTIGPVVNKWWQTLKIPITVRSTLVTLKICITKNKLIFTLLHTTGMGFCITIFAKKHFFIHSMLVAC